MREEYQENGYVVLDSAFRQADLDAFSGELRRMVRFKLDAIGESVPDGDEFSAGIASLEAAGHALIADISDTIPSMPSFLRLVTCEEIEVAVKSLLQVDTGAPIYLTNGAAIVALPHDRDFTYGWHKDVFYTIPRSHFVQLWAPLVQDSTVELGTLQVCPSSHKTGVRGSKVVEGVPNRHRYIVDEEEIRRWNVLDLPLKLGQAALFHGCLAHRSGANTSDICRYSLVGVFHQVEREGFRPLLMRGEFQGESPESYFREVMSR